MQVDRRITSGQTEKTDQGGQNGESDQVAFLVGQDGEGHWLAVEIHGLGGGIFASRDKAVRYARDESHRLPGAIRFADGPMRLFAA